MKTYSGRFAYPVRAFRAVSDGYERVSERDLLAVGCTTDEAIGEMAIGELADISLLVDLTNLTVVAAGGLVFSLESWLPAPFVGVSLN